MFRKSSEKALPENSMASWYIYCGAKKYAAIVRIDSVPILPKDRYGHIRSTYMKTIACKRFRLAVSVLGQLKVD